MIGERLLKIFERLLVMPERKVATIDRPVYWVGSNSVGDTPPSGLSSDQIHTALMGIRQDQFLLAKNGLAAADRADESQVSPADREIRD